MIETDWLTTSEKTEVLDSSFMGRILKCLSKGSGELLLLELLDLLCKIGSSWLAGFLIRETLLKKESEEFDLKRVGLLC